MPERFAQGAGDKWGPGGEHVIKNRAQGIDIRRRGQRAVTGVRLLGREVARGAENLAGDREIRITGHFLGQSEIGDPRFAERIDQDIGRFEVAVQNALLMGILNRFGQGLEIGRRPLGGEGASGLQLGKVGAFHKIHGKVADSLVLADLVNGHNVGVLQSGGRGGLGAEPADVFRAGELTGRKHLYGHNPPKTALAGFVNDAHAAARHLLDQLIVAESAQEERVAEAGSIAGLGWFVAQTFRHQTAGAKAVEARRGEHRRAFLTGNHRRGRKKLS